MGLDLNKVVKDLKEFYPLKGKSVLHVGIGGGAMLAYTADAASITAVDNNPMVEKVLPPRLKALGMDGKTTLLYEDFYDFSSKEHFDVVFFEFCLHETADSLKAVEYAKRFADDVLIIDHTPDSRWSWYCCETEKITRSWDAMKGVGFREDVCRWAMQRYDSFDELSTKLSVAGDEAVRRVQELRGKEPVEIVMPYRLSLV